jgi:integrase
MERLDTVETPDTLERVLLAVGTFSESLRRHRRDRGADPGVLSRADVLAFSNDLAQLEAAGQLSRYLRRLTMSGVNQFLREARAMGLTGPGRPAAGLPDDVVLHPSDQIRRVSTDEDGRALPAVVVEQLLAPEALELLEAASGADVRAMVELQVLVGRRTGELCGLRWDCLSADEMVSQDGQARPAPVLIHDMPKVAVRRYHLPIGHDAAEVIRTQQTSVRARYPDTPTAELALFPAPHRNSRGVKARSPINLRECLRSWLAALPRLVGPADDPYDRSTITPYSFRHAYAQRHADAGTPVEVLAALMGHRKLTTTQGYYRVGQERKRAAVDLLAALQVDHAGERTRPTVERLLDAEHLRDTKWPCPSASAGNRPTSKPTARPARSATSASAALTSTATPPTCPSCVATSAAYWPTVSGSGPPPPNWRSGPATAPSPPARRSPPCDASSSAARGCWAS